MSAPYTIDFSTVAPGDTAIPDVIESGAADWTITPMGRYAVSARAGFEPFSLPAHRSAALDVSNLAGKDFELTTRFILADFASVGPSGSAIGLMGFSALSEQSNFFASRNARYHLALLLTPTQSGPAGRLSLVEIQNNQSGPFDIMSADALPIAVGAAYELTLRGDVQDGQLHLTGLGSDGTNTISVAGSDATPRSGRYFGLAGMAAYNSGNVRFSAETQYLTIVPEPSVVPLLLLPLLRRRRRAPRPNS